MNLQHLSLKLYLAQPVDLAPFVGVFNQWIQRQTTPQRVVPDLLLDVADYVHVPAGPGLLLIGHEATYSLDWIDKRLGLLYQRKAKVEGTNTDKLLQAAQSVLRAAQVLEQENQVVFDGREVQLIINDRLLAPNTPATREALTPDLSAFFIQLFGGQTVTTAFRADPRERFTVNAQVADAVSVEQMLKNLNAVTIAGGV